MLGLNLILGLWRKLLGRDGGKEQVLKSVVPPDLDPDFVGRKAEIEQAVNKLTKGKTGVYIQGGPGIGKSALARQVVNEKKVRKKFNKGVVWIHLTDENLGQVCNRVASALNIRQVQETENEAEKVAALRAALEKSSHLVVLDNADGPLAPMARRFAEDVTRRVLVTSRDTVPGLDQVPLGPMSPDEAVDLLVAKGPKTLPADQRALLPQIAGMVEYSPLALELAAGQLVGMQARELIDSLNKRLLDPLFAPNDEDK
ncbi:MAG: AAA family ATPase, partial [Chloroflexi bacterium]|nr:AAA family ATPase [Chloroflexota bacterium]